VPYDESEIQKEESMKVLKLLALAGVLVLSATSTSPATNYGVRQYYSGWSHTSYGYYYRTYYYRPYPTYTSYNYHYVIYYPSRPAYYYYYNPHRRVYWGRSPVKNDGKAVYSLLADEHRKGMLNEIKEEHFPKPGAMPAVPESNDGTKMAVPPSDLPKAR
jgi:hypothetical protein